MIERIVESTDNKFIGSIYDPAQDNLKGLDFRPSIVKDVGNGFTRYSHSTYSILTKRDS